MKDLVIPGNFLEELNISPADMRIEFAVFLYESERLTLNQAKKLSGITQIEFQKELSKRGILIKYDVEDFEKDLETLKNMK
jgi:predicted HTH domain antitoxin